MKTKAQKKIRKAIINKKNEIEIKKLFRGVERQRDIVFIIAIVEGIIITGGVLWILVH